MNPPVKKPRKATAQEFIFKFSAISIPGESNDQKDAAIITPAANPSIPSIIVLLIFLKKKTTDAPSIVTNQVNNVAMSAPKIGFIPEKKEVIESPFYLPKQN